MGDVTAAASRMPSDPPLNDLMPVAPMVLRLTPPAPFVDTALAITIASVAPLPVSMLKSWFAAPRETAPRFTPLSPIVIESAPEPPTTDRPANFGRIFRSTAIVSACVSILMPVIGVDDVIVPADLAVTVSTPVDVL